MVKKKHMELPPRPVPLQTIALTLREDEVEYLDELAKSQGKNRQQVLRSILRGGMSNPMPKFFDHLMERDGVVKGTRGGDNG